MKVRRGDHHPDKLRFTALLLLGIAGITTGRLLQRSAR